MANSVSTICEKRDVGLKVIWETAKESSNFLLFYLKFSLNRTTHPIHLSRLEVDHVFH